MKNNIGVILAIAMLMLIVFVGCNETENGATQTNGITGGAVTNTEGGSTPTETNPIVIEEPTDGSVLDVNALIAKIQCSDVVENTIYVITQSPNLMTYSGETTAPKIWKIYVPTAAGMEHLAYFHNIEIRSMVICGKNITIVIDNGEKDPLLVSDEEAQEILNNPLIAKGFGMLRNGEGPDSGPIEKEQTRGT
jgi:hypothetical protein